jgi:hypothetical protein
MTISLLTVAGHVSLAPDVPFFTASAALHSALTRLSLSSVPSPNKDPSLKRPSVPDFSPWIPSWNRSSARGLDLERERANGFIGRLGKLIALAPENDRLCERIGYVHSGPRGAC